MRRFLVVLNSVIAIFFAGFLVYTLFGKAHIRRLATDYISAKLEPGARRSATLAKAALNTPQIRNRVKREQIEAALAEINEFEATPREYIRSLTDPRSAPRTSQAVTTVPADLMAKIGNWKKGVRERFDRIYGRIIVEVRVFGASNLAAGCLCIYLVRRFGAQARILAISLVLTLSVLYCSFLYIDQNWFFAILHDSFLGVW